MHGRTVRAPFAEKDGRPEYERHRVASRTVADIRRLLVLALVLTLVGSARDGILRIGLALSPNTLDPLVSSQYIENYIQEAIFDGLVVVDDRGDLQPDLALEVPTRRNGGISSDGRTITYHLRHHVRWQDGVAFTARDVAFTFAKIRDPHVPFSLGTWYAKIARLDTPDAFTVVLHLKVPTADAAAEFFVNGENGMVVPEHLLGQVADLQTAPFGNAPIGTGPYRVERWERGSSLDLRANPNYFRGAPRIARVHIVFVSDQNTLAVQKRTGELDFTPNLPLSQISTLIDSPSMTVRRVPSYLLDYLVANVRTPPLADVRVRRALALAIDRGTLVRTTFHGAAVVADGMVPPWSRFHTPAPGSPQRPNASAAGALLDAAGWRIGPDGMRRKDNIPLRFAMTTIAGQTVLLNAAVQLQADWRAVGVDVDLRPLQSTVLFAPDGVLSKGAFTLAFINYGELPWPDISDNVSSDALPPRGHDYGGFIDRTIDRELVQSLVTADLAARRAIVARIDARLRASASTIPVVWEQFLDAWDGQLLGVRPETVNSDLWNIGQWRWK
jgi:peptide/nickel transport system substrate-binding protein